MALLVPSPRCLSIACCASLPSQTRIVPTMKPFQRKRPFGVLNVLQPRSPSVNPLRSARQAANPIPPWRRARSTLFTYCTDGPRPKEMRCSGVACSRRQPTAAYDSIIVPARNILQPNGSTDYFGSAALRPKYSTFSSRSAMGSKRSPLPSELSPHGCRFGVRKFGKNSLIASPSSCRLRRSRLFAARSPRANSALLCRQTGRR